MAVMRAVSPCTVMRRPPAAELVASVTVGSTGPTAASKAARADARPIPTSPSSTEVAATPWPRSRGVAASPSPSPERPSNALTTVVVEPISATRASTWRDSHGIRHTPVGVELTRDRDEQTGQVVVGDAPDQWRRHGVVPVRQDVAEPDHVAGLGQTLGQRLVGTQRAHECLARDLELPLHRRGQERVRPVVLEGAPVEERLDPRASGEHVGERDARVTRPHRAPPWSPRTPLSGTGSAARPPR